MKMKTNSAESQVVVLTDGNFEQRVIEARVPVVVDFWAEWCPPCRALNPVMENLAGTFGDGVTIGKVDVDANKSLAAKYKVNSIPTVLLFAEGELRERWVGLRPEGDYKAAVEKWAR